MIFNSMIKNQEKFIEKNLLPHHYYYWKCEKNHMWKETWEKRKNNPQQKVKRIKSFLPGNNLLQK